MTKQSKNVSREEYNLVAEREAILGKLVHWKYNGHKPDAVETAKYQDGTYRFELWGATTASGGLLVQLFKYPGQSDSISVSYFETARNYRWPTELSTALGRLSVARHTIIQNAGMVA